MKSIRGLLACATLVAGCAIRPLPDGSHLERLPAEQLAQAAPPVSPGQREQLRQLDAQVLAQQEQALQREAWLVQAQQARLQWELGYGWGWPQRPWFRDRRGRYDWDGWRAGFWGPWPY